MIVVFFPEGLSFFPVFAEAAGKVLQLLNLFSRQEGFDLLVHRIDQAFSLSPEFDMAFGDQAGVAVDYRVQLLLLRCIRIDDVIKLFFKTRRETHFCYAVDLLDGHVTMGEKPRHKSYPYKGKYSRYYF